MNEVSSNYKFTEFMVSSSLLGTKVTSCSMYTSSKRLKKAKEASETHAVISWCTSLYIRHFCRVDMPPRGKAGVLWTGSR